MSVFFNMRLMGLGAAPRSTPRAVTLMTLARTGLASARYSLRAVRLNWKRVV